MKKWYLVQRRDGFDLKNTIFFGTEEELLRNHVFSPKDRAEYKLYHEGENSLQLLGPEGYENLPELEEKLWGMDTEARVFFLKAKAIRRNTIKSNKQWRKEHKPLRHISPSKKSLGDLLRKFS